MITVVPSSDSLITVRPVPNSCLKRRFANPIPCLLVDIHEYCFNMFCIHSNAIIHSTISLIHHVLLHFQQLIE